MKILITGAAGFLGAAMVRRAVAAGHDVRAMVREGSPRGRVGLPDAAIVVADMMDADGLARAVSGGIEAVIHCAATTSVGATDEALSWKVNVEGTRLLYEAARAASVGRWIQISSMSAHPAMKSVYGRTKLAADEFLRKQNGRPDWTILRPSLIYGPGERGVVAKSVRLMKKLPVIPVIGSGGQLIRPIYVDDVADAALACLGAGLTIRKTYMIGGADEVSLNEFMAAISRASGLRRPIVHVPIPLAMIMARAMGAVMKNPPITVDNVQGVSGSQRVDTSLAERDIPWAPIGFQEGLRRTFGGE